MTAYELKNTAILNVKGVGFRCILLGISRDGAINMLNNSVLEDKGVLQMYFGKYFRDIYSGVNESWYRNSWKEFDQLKNIDQKFYCSDYYNVSVNKYGFKCVTALRFWENKYWINEIDPYGWFQWYFRYWLFRRSKDDERQINI